MKYWISILLFVTVFGLYGQERVFSLQHCITTGLVRNYDIRMIRNSQQISDNNLSRGNAGFLPQLDLSAGYSGLLNNTEQRMESTGEIISISGEHNQTLNAGINLNWTVFDGFNIQTSYNRLKELQQVGELNTRLTVENFVAEVAAEYYNFIQQQIRLKSLQYAVRLSNERVRIVEARYVIGAASRLEFQRAKVDFNSDSSRLVQQNEVLFKSRIKLNELMALDDVEQEVVLADSIIETGSGMEKETLMRQLLSDNILLLLYRKDRKLAELNLKMAKSQNYPYVKLSVGYGYSHYLYDRGTFDRQQTLGLNYGILLGYSLFDGGNRRRQLKNASLEISNKELEYRKLELSLRGDFSNIWMAYLNNRELKELEKENLQTAQDSYGIAIDRYKLGDLAGFELREAQNQLIEAEERLVQAQYNTKLCEISLLQISGQILNLLD
ncbi:MAG: TolC family protein [Bacteroidales bacterium]|nr:TolC family protein [Bacteroidales bacterium]